MLLAAIGFLLITIALSFALVSASILDGSCPVAKETEQKLQAGLGGALFVFIVGLLFLQSGPLIIATIGVIIFSWSLYKRITLGWLAGGCMMGFSVVLQYI